MRPLQQPHPDPEGKLVEHRDLIVRRVVHALEETRDPEALVHAYFDEDRDAVIEATRQTLEATREEVSPEKVAAIVDRELIEGLRFPVDRRRSLAASLYIHRGKAALAATLAAIAWLVLLVL